jgi:DNA-directed RNA polymerase beta subunit
VAIATGYNQEDSIIMNLSSVNVVCSTAPTSIHYRDENDDEENGFSEYFSNPIDRSVTVKSGSVMRALTLTVYLGSDHIHPGVALIGKVL